MRIALLEADLAAADCGFWRLAAELVARGHGVTVVGASRGPHPTIGGVGMIPLWRPPRLPAQRFYEDHIELAPAAIWRLARGRFDVAHAFAPALGWAAAQARRFRGPPFAYSHPGEPTRRWLVDRHYRVEMMLATASAASSCFVDDRSKATAFRRCLLREAEVIDPGAHAAERFEAAYARCAARSRSG